MAGKLEHEWLEFNVPSTYITGALLKRIRVNLHSCVNSKIPAHINVFAFVITEVVIIFLLIFIAYTPVIVYVHYSTIHVDGQSLRYYKIALQSPVIMAN